MIERFSREAQSALLAMERYTKTHERVWSIPRDTAEFLHTLALGLRAKRGLELGTSIGYSGTWLALAFAATGGRLDTVEHDSVKVETARRNFDQAGVADFVRVIEGDVGRVLPRLRGRYDFVFMDTDKEDYLRHFRKLQPLLSGRSVVAADNALSHPREMKPFTDFLARSRTWRSTVVPVGSGVILMARAKQERPREAL